ncbi:hypothetical protein GCM10023188_43620 [Pontibacter saemangeumensis]|uniref:LacI family transcriptional regulator n=1 Tax=Pontibacter saemangeumensis TaxID=1084525 RepID=A0ABP8M2V4_9BACT
MDKNPRVTIHDIAQRLGITASTVSRLLPEDRAPGRGSRLSVSKAKGRAPSEGRPASVYIETKRPQGKRQP